MDSLLFAINAVAPIMLMMVVGYCLKKWGLMDGVFGKAANRLVFHVFLPVMLFLNIYKTDHLGGMKLGYIGYVMVVVTVIFLCAIPYSMAVARKKESRGALLQGAFRSNYALIGIPLAQSLFGEEGVLVASLLSAAVVPYFNALAVVSLSLFRKGEKPNVKRILLGICQNPLIQGIAAGLLVVGMRVLFERWGIDFRLSDVKPVYRVLEDLAKLATPMALLVLGAQFEFSAVKELRREIVCGTVMRTVLVPLLGIGGAYLLFRNQLSGAHFAAFVAVFATPVSVSSVPMAQEMEADVTLAGQLVVWTTLFSALSVFLVSFLLRLAGIF
ncbi:MAG: AEC family transporter [Clostridia bacterium]|nr:AEC family transporter [Clostridia bacterium]